MVLVRSIQAYFENIVTSIIFVLMGVFGFFFILLSDFYLSSGNVFLEYGFWNSPLLDVVVSLALIFISLAFFCVFCAAVIFAVRADLTKVKFLHYVTEKLPRFSMELFEFFSFCGRTGYRKRVAFAGCSKRGRGIGFACFKRGAGVCSSIDRGG